MDIDKITLLKEYDSSLIDDLLYPDKLLAWNQVREQGFKLIFSKNWDKFFELIQLLPDLLIKTTVQDGTLVIGDSLQLTGSEHKIIEDLIKLLIPWRKGPVRLFDIQIESEWRSNLKWDRIKNEIDLKSKTILDIGCGNGYYMLRMLEQNPKFILGIDPIDRFFLVFQFLQKFIKSKKIQFDPVGLEVISCLKASFDYVFLMGILYHRRDPIDALRLCKDRLLPGGKLVLETMIIPGSEPVAFCNSDRYCKMHNVYFIPTESALLAWLKKAGFKKSLVVNISKTDFNEQRTTEYAPYLSLDSFLDSSNPNLTVEGHPAPLRIVVISES